uniref:Uncharacterized protein n=1 Tax=Leersia perrieri TaxID=77586 RepID=A0A0D9XIW8_9ORYZ
MRSQGGNCEVKSSIALLQERFRKLQKVREMREGREQLQTTTSPVAAATAVSSDDKPPRWFSHPELVRPARPAIKQLAAATIGDAGVQPPAVSLGSRTAVVLQSSGCRSDVEVDTSLHL